MQNRVVVRYQDRRLLKGSTTDFLPTKDVFHLTSADDPAIRPLEIRLSQAKAVFFVKHLEGNPAYRERKEFDPARPTIGRRIRVVFKDGELLVGTTQSYHPGRPGFFVIPADPGSNNERCFVVSTAVRNVAFI
jgi:Family of unknown function (DUF6982)